jgi:hypothetical protein
VSAITDSCFTAFAPSTWTLTLFRVLHCTEQVTSNTGKTALAKAPYSFPQINTVTSSGLRLRKVLIELLADAEGEDRVWQLANEAQIETLL